MFNVIDFKPDLIIEVTNICNKSCKGCYALNVSEKETDKIKNLDPNVLYYSLRKTHHLNEIKTVSIRGGEPSLNPKLVEIMKVLKNFNFDKVYLETDGDWITTNSPLLKNLIDMNITLKISADKMHNSDETTSDRRFQILNQYGLEFVVAITEKTLDECEQFAITYFPDLKNNFIFQIKKFSNDELIKPKYGVLNVDGIFKTSLTSRFKNANLVESNL